MKIFIIGCGGVGSWLAHSIVKLHHPDDVVLVDGDILEMKNLDRQLFSESDIGRAKSTALAERLDVAQFDEDFYSVASYEHDASDMLLCCVDNHPGRASVLESCDRFQCTAICGANETYSAEAFIYKPEWKGTARDPRVYYPEITTSQAGDPRRAATGCTGIAQIETPQLVSANFLAAGLMQHLLVAHTIAAVGADAEAVNALPYKLSASLSRLEHFKHKGE